MKQIYQTTEAPKEMGDLSRIFHNLNVDIAKDLKSEGVEDGYIYAQIDQNPFSYTAKYVSEYDVSKFKPDDGQELIPVSAFIEYMRFH